jgi:hypothetical protein
MVDLSKIKPGDEIAVRATVRTLDPEMHHGGPGVEVGFCSGLRGWVRDTAIVSHTPKALSVGDRVRPTFSGGWEAYRGIVRAIDDGEAWVRWETGLHARPDWSLSDLERLP